HKLRSTFATLLLRETENLAIVQDALGHSDPRTTRIYAKVLDEQLRRAADHIKFR
ncbi:MAG: tyrosine-type recombinase/integrase, partial [Bacillota bacterium]